MKKIIYLANARMPTEKAHGIQIAKMCEAFALHGLEVELVLPTRINRIKQSVFEYYGIKERFKVKKLLCLDFIALGIPKIGFWLESLNFAITSFFYSLFKKADIIYCRDLPILFPLIFFKKNIVLEMHSFPGHSFLYKFILRKSKAIVVLTRKLKETLLARDINERKIIVAPDAVDLSLFKVGESKNDCRKKMNLPQNKKIVLYAGSLYQWKGVEILAQAARFLTNDVLVVFAGGPSEELKKFKAKTADIKNVLILGEQPYSEIPYYLKAADVLVLPNSKKNKISQFWTSPLKMFEYMVSGVPIVASDLPSIREILNGKNALFFEPDNPDSLAKKIKLALENNYLSDKIAEQACKDAENYTWQKRAERIVSFII